MEAAELARAQKLRVCCKTIEEYASTHRAERWEPFDGITLINVLEHVPHPVEVVETCRGMLGSAGVLVVRVPNDFTEMQAAAHAKLGGPISPSTICARCWSGWGSRWFTGRVTFRWSCFC